jgi:hypothetical protein
MVSVELFALLMIFLQQILRGQHLFLLLRELTLVEVAAEVDELLHGEATALLVTILRRDLMAVIPPVDEGLAVLHLHRLGLGEMLVALGHVEAVEPRLLRVVALRRALGMLVVEEEDVRGDARVRGEDTARQAHDGVEVELPQQLRLDGELGAVGAEEEAVGEDDGRAPVSLQPVHHQHDEHIGRLRRPHLSGEVELVGSCRGTTVGRVHGLDVDLVLLLILRDFLGEGVAVKHVRRLDAVDEEVRDAKEVRQRLPLLGPRTVLIDLLILHGLHRRTDIVEEGDNEAEGAAGPVAEGLAELRVEEPDDDVGQGTGGIELTGIACRLEAFEDALIDVAEHVAVLSVGEVDLVDDVDDLPELHAVLHILVDVLEDLLDDGLRAWRVLVDLEVLQGGEEAVVDEVEERLARERLAVLMIRGPVAPAVFLGYDAHEVVLRELPCLFLCVVDLEEEHPDHLLDALCVAVDAGVCPHHILYAFY